MSGAVCPNNPWKLSGLWGVRISFPDLHHMQETWNEEMVLQRSFLAHFSSCLYWWYVGCELGRGEMDPPKVVVDNCVWATILCLEHSKGIKAACSAVVSVCRAHRFHRLAADDGGRVWLWGGRRQEGSPLQTIYSCWVFRVIEEGNCCTFMHLIHGLPGEEGGNDSSVGNRGGLLQGCLPLALFPLFLFQFSPWLQGAFAGVIDGVLGCWEGERVSCG